MGIFQNRDPGIPNKMFFFNTDLVLKTIWATSRHFKKHRVSKSILFGGRGLSYDLIFAHIIAISFHNQYHLVSGNILQEPPINYHKPMLGLFFEALVALVIPAGDLGQLFSTSNWSQATDTIPTLLLPG